VPNIMGSPQKTTSSSPIKPGSARQTFLICLGLAAATVAVYWRVGTFAFLDYDDPSIFFLNGFVHDGLAWKSVVWGATTSYYEYWHPLMWWSHMLDCQLFGMNAGLHHLVSLAFHVANTLLVFALFRRMTGMVWRSAMVAALFGLHPLHVESVAWLAERKDLLSTFFALLSMWAYAGYVERAKVQNPRSKACYALALFMFLLGLLSKPMVVTLPFVLVLLDYWPLNRIEDLRVRILDFGKRGGKNTLGRMVWEKWPFFGLTAMFCFITWYSVKAGNHLPSVKAGSEDVHWPNIPVAYVRYLWKTIYPCNLAVLYPMPDHIPVWQVMGAMAALLGITWLVMRARESRFLFFGWFLFLGVLVPTIGVVRVGAQAMADRYMYESATGLFVAAVWGVAELSKRWRYRTALLSGLGGIAVAACAAVCWIQVQYWYDSVSLWKHCLAAGYESVIAHHDLGRALIDAGEPGKGLDEYEAALKMDPDDPYANQGYGTALLAAGRLNEATNYLAKALQVDPGNASVHGDMGMAMMGLTNYDEAMAQIWEEIRLEQNPAAAYAKMGKIYSAQGKSDDAENWYLKALQQNSAYGPAYYYLGVEYAQRGKLDEAATNLVRATELSPAALSFRIRLAQVYDQQGKIAEAISAYHAALRLNPHAPETMNNLAWILATTPDPTLQNGAEAVKLGLQACELTHWDMTLFIGTLAAAYAAAGDFDKAVETAQKACDVATAHGEKELLQANQNLMAQYKNRQPFRQKSGN
jgi:tetratricopeptide (TPR) repeat protein